MIWQTEHWFVYCAIISLKFDVNICCKNTDIFFLIHCGFYDYKLVIEFLFKVFRVCKVGGFHCGCSRGAVDHCLIENYDRDLHFLFPVQCISWYVCRLLRNRGQFLFLSECHVLDSDAYGRNL